MTSRPDAAVLASPVIRQALVPMAAFYLILMAALGLGLLRLRRRGAGQASGPTAAPDAPRGWAALARHVLGTAIGGYLLLLAVDVAYYYGVARVGGAFLSSAVTGPALLIGLAMPVFAVASWISRRVHGRCEKQGKAQPPPQ
jgi:hypothetical protein